MRAAKSSERLGWRMGTVPTKTWPVAPSMVMMSPLLSVRCPTRIMPALASIRSDPAPDTHGTPMPRATTAAWLVMPPRAVRMPAAACMP